MSSTVIEFMSTINFPFIKSEPSKNKLASLKYSEPQCDSVVIFLPVHLILLFSKSNDDCENKIPGKKIKLSRYNKFFIVIILLKLCQFNFQGYNL